MVLGDRDSEMTSSSTSLQVGTVDIANPSWSGASPDLEPLPTDVSFLYYVTTFNFRTLSSTNVQSGEQLSGLLYVPDLPRNDPCNEAAAPYVPANVTRQANLPNANYNLIALAPWLSPDCVQKYLSSASSGPAQAFVFFLPDNSTSEPPDEDSSAWALGDSQQWKNLIQYPVYAVPGRVGNILMNASAQYSGNVTEIPYASELEEILDPRDYVRLYAKITTASGGAAALPSLWVFLLVVLGILLSIIGLTSLTMHVLQRHRRVSLRRRVANGEVDLEALGIKRLTVPQDLLDRMPLYTYGSGAPVATPTAARESILAEAADKLSTSSSRPSSPIPTSRPKKPILTRAPHSFHPAPLSQPTCAICLDDFVPAPDPLQSSSSPTSQPPAGDAATDSVEGPQTGTIVRELPCHHIFHPECVDSFLRDSSSLCPLCKKTALPKGYCPRVVTNAMVRRERMSRRIRPDAADMVTLPPLAGPRDAEQGGWRIAGSRARSWRGARISGGLGTGNRGFWEGPAGGTTGNSNGFPTTTPAEEMNEMQPSASAARRSSTGFSLSRYGRRSVTGPAAPQGGGSSALESTAENPRPPVIQPPDNPSRREWARERAIAMLGRDRAPEDPDAEDAPASGWRKVLRGMFPRAGGGRQ